MYKLAEIMLSPKRLKQFEVFSKKERYFLQPIEKQYFENMTHFFKTGENYKDYPLNYSGYLSYQLDDIIELLNPLDELDDVDERILKFITQPIIWSNIKFYNRLHKFIETILKNENKDNNIYLLWKKLSQYNISEIEFVDDLFLPEWHKYFTNIYFCSFLAEKILLHKDNLRTFNNSLILSALINYEKLTQESQIVEQFIHSIFFNSPNKSKYMFNESRTLAMLFRYSLKYKEIGEKILHKQDNIFSKAMIAEVLIHFFPSDFRNTRFEIISEYIESSQEEKWGHFKISSYNYDEEYKYLIYDSCPSYDITDIYFVEYFKNKKIYDWNLFKNKFSTKINFSLKGLKKIINIVENKSIELLLAIIDNSITGDFFNKSKLKEYLNLLIHFPADLFETYLCSLAKHKSKKIRELAAVTLSKLGDRSIPEAEKLLNDKKAEIRQTAALILTLLNSAQAQAVLMNAIDSEKNDDARDTMLEGVVGWLASQATQEAVLQRVAKAKTRGKLEKPLEWWLDETQLPALYWQDSQKSIDSEVVRFLCYRMSRAKDIRTDPEAKPLLALIDRQSSGDFAKNLLKLYFDNGGDAKYKFCLTLGGLLGDDDSSELLKRKVNDWADNGRGKMAEYAVKALALQGSNKALRAVEFFSRKYKNKYKNIGAAAHEAFGIAAEELGISPYDLADSIIPDFGFEGLFREFEVDGETYRAFINTDFKMVFLNEDNRLLKSPPKGISKELAEEFKEITKEIRDIVKSQSSRLEQYLVIQRKWETEKWQAFFLQNPVMFAYAVRLIWGAYDADGHLKFTFRCEQDQTLLNAEGEEAELDEDLQIGMVHPISLSPALIDYWNGSLYDADIEPIFPQLNRKVITLPDGDRSLVISNEFKGVKYSGYGFTSKMEKLGWYRGSVVDGGWISSFYKDFAEVNITAIITQQGEIGVGYLEGNAELSELMFVKRNQVSFGSYVYDEPSNANDARLVPFGDLPPIVYSEVMADMQFFKDNQLKD